MTILLSSSNRSDTSNHEFEFIHPLTERGFTAPLKIFNLKGVKGGGLSAQKLKNRSRTDSAKLSVFSKHGKVNGATVNKKH